MPIPIFTDSGGLTLAAGFFLQSPAIVVFWFSLKGIMIAFFSSHHWGPTISKGHPSSPLEALGRILTVLEHASAHSPTPPL